MKPVLRLRLTACLIWLISGIMQGNFYGYASALASLLFIIALFMEVAENS